MNPILLDVLGVLARSLLLALTGYLQKQHLLTPEQSDKLVALGVEHLVIWAPGAFAIGWGIWKSWFARKKLLVAASSSTPMSENEIKAIVKSGVVTPTVATPKNTIPRRAGMIRILRILFLLACLFTPLLVHAQALPVDKLTPPLQSEQGQAFMRGMSWGTLGGGVALKTWEAWHATDKKKALAFEAIGLTATGLTSLGVKTLVGRDRPCAPADCGTEDPYKAFWSGHVANACFSIPMASGRGAAIAGSLLALGTAIGRILGNRHFLTDTLAGCGAGTMFGLLTKMAVGKWVR